MSAYSVSVLAVGSGRLAQAAAIATAYAFRPSSVSSLCNGIGGEDRAGLTHLGCANLSLRSMVTRRWSDIWDRADGRTRVSMTDDRNRELMRMRSIVARVRRSFEYQVARWWGRCWNMELVTTRLCSVHSVKHRVPLSLGLTAVAMGAVGV